jgi:hypothetical protein
MPPRARIGDLGAFARAQGGGAPLLLAVVAPGVVGIGVFGTVNGELSSIGAFWMQSGQWAWL